jgi:hypothetical protein
MEKRKVTEHFKHNFKLLLKQGLAEGWQAEE